MQALALIVAPVVALSLAQDNESTGFLVLAILPAVWVALRRDLVVAAVGLLVLNTSLSIGAARVLGATAELSEVQAVMLAASLGGPLRRGGHPHPGGGLRRPARERGPLPRGARRHAVPHGALHPLTVTCASPTSRPGWPRPAEPTRSSRPFAATGRRSGARWRPTAPGSITPGRWTIDGRRQWFTARLGPERLANGTIDGVVAVISDLTPAREAEAEAERERWTDPLTGLANRRRFFDLLGDRRRTARRARPGGRHARPRPLQGSERGARPRRPATRCCCTSPTGFAAPSAPTASSPASAADEFAVAVPVDDLADHGRHRRAPAHRRPHPRARRRSAHPGDLQRGRGGRQRRHAGDPRGAGRRERVGRGQGGRPEPVDACTRIATGWPGADREARLALIHQCLDRQTVVVHYQPLVDLATGQTVAVEALCRLPDPAGGLVPPGAFIPLAEEAALDVRLGALVLVPSARGPGALAEPTGGRGADDGGERHGAAAHPARLRPPGARGVRARGRVASTACASSSPRRW